MGVIIILLLFLNYGLPEEINVFGAKWCLKNCDQSKPISTNSEKIFPPENKPSTALDIIFIEDLHPRQQIYGIDDSATIDFKINDKLDVPYNFTVKWYHNSTPYYGWYNESNITKPFYSFYPVTKVGTWKVQVVAKWNYLNQSFSKDAVTSFEVS